MQKIKRIGETNVNSHGSIMTIIEYNNFSDITIEFEKGYKIGTTYANFKNGLVKYPYDKTVYDIGYLGIGNYIAKISGKRTIQYQYWYNMLTRCYNKEYHLNHPTYEDKYVCEEWLNFQVFAKWFDENYYEISNDKMCLDKDILCKGNKMYSPINCVFVPQRINSLFIKRQNYRGDYPLGVSYSKRNNKFKARCNTFEDNVHIGYFNTPKDAFYEGYKPFKEDYIKEVANDYKDKIPQNLYEAMYKYVVEIDD